MAYLLVQVKLLRNFASFGTLNKIHQSHLYLLEHGVDSALRETNPNIAEQCSDWFQYPFLISDDYYTGIVDDIAKQYVLGPQGKSRIKKLPKLLKALSLFSDEYRAFATELESVALKTGCSPHDLKDLAEWPDFKV